MAGLFSPHGLLSMYRLAAAPSLLAFDLDGTLAPLELHASDAKVPPNTATYLKALARVWPFKGLGPRLAFGCNYRPCNRGRQDSARLYAPVSRW